MNTRWLVRNWFRVGHRISWKLSFETLASLLYFVPAFHRDSVYRIVEAKHRCVFSYLERDFSYLIDRYKDKPLGAVVPEHRYIWVMWWQGEQAAPELVRMCIDSIRRNANGAEVVVITKDNYRDYVDIPDYIIEKHRAGVISFAHLADITRMFLLAEYGGLWLDSTIYVSRAIPEDIFTKAAYYHSRTPKYNTIYRGKLIENSQLFDFDAGMKYLALLTNDVTQKLKEIERYDAEEILTATAMVIIPEKGGNHD